MASCAYACDHQTCQRVTRRYFSLLEIAVALGILLLIAAVTLPLQYSAYQKWQFRSQVEQLQNRLKTAKQTAYLFRRDVEVQLGKEKGVWTLLCKPESAVGHALQPVLTKPLSLGQVREVLVEGAPVQQRLLFSYSRSALSSLGEELVLVGPRNERARIPLTFRPGPLAAEEIDGGVGALYPEGAEE